MTKTPFMNHRIVSLDVFRGLTIVMMILVNSQGTRFPYPLLEHAAWNGCTLADLVFPFFLFIVGVTTVISLNIHSKKEGGVSRQIYSGIVQRTVILFALGLILNIFPNHIDLASLRYFGILQRIALCYLICSVVFLNTSTKMQILIFLVILWVYWVIMTMIPVPGFGANVLTEQGTWVAYFDQMLFSSPQLFGKTYDPEGLLSTLPSIASTLAGVLTGVLLLTSHPDKSKCIVLIVIGCLFLSLGWAWNLSFPINKNLWTSSFVLWTSGLSLITFALCFFVIDMAGYTRWAFPLKVFGMNALFAFIFHVALLKIQGYFFVALKSGATVNIKVAITEFLFGSFSAQNAALLYSLAFIVLNYLVVLIMYKKKIFIRV